jgi:hypothetical protein
MGLVSLWHLHLRGSLRRMAGQTFSGGLYAGGIAAAPCLACDIRSILGRSAKPRLYRPGLDLLRLFGGVDHDFSNFDYVGLPATPGARRGRFY